MPYCQQLEDEWRAWNKQSELYHIELEALTLAECYAFAGRMRKFLPRKSDHHVGTLAHCLVMRANRKGMSLKRLEEIFIKKFGDIPDIWEDV